MFSKATTKISGNNLDNEVVETEIQSNWYVFYTAPRAEKVVYKDLVTRQYEVFLPTIKTLRVWKNRQKKMIESVLFPGYIFVKTQLPELYNIVKVPKIACYIKIAGKPAIMPLVDIERVKKMLSINQEVTAESDFFEGEKVRIIYGPLAGYEGILVKQKGKTRFGIELKEIRHTMFIDICATVLEKVD